MRHLTRMVVAVLLAAGCAAGVDPSAPVSQQPSAHASPTSAASADPAATYRLAISTALPKLQFSMFGFCSQMGRPLDQMPSSDDLYSATYDAGIRDAANQLTRLGPAPKGWLEVSNLAQHLGSGAIAAELASILLINELKQGITRSDVEGRWVSEVLEPCDAILVDIKRAEEMLDKLP